MNAVSVNQNALKRKAEMDAHPTPALPSYVGGQDTVLKNKFDAKVKKLELIGAQFAKNSIAKDEDGGRRARQVLKRRAPDTAPDDARVDAPQDVPLLQAQVPTPQSAQQPAAAEAVAPVYPDVNFSDSDDLRLLHLHQQAQLPENLSDYGTDFNGGVLDDEYGEESQWRGLTAEEEIAEVYDLGFEILAHHAQIAFYGEDFSYLKKQDRPRTRSKKYCDTCLIKKQLALFAKDDDEVDMIDT